jgi:DNA-directed RNA polymerase specialized sigma24 family protein
VERALAGDVGRVRRDCASLERRVFALAYGILGREEEARDATQETFIAPFVI